MKNRNMHPCVEVRVCTARIQVDNRSTGNFFIHSMFSGSFYFTVKIRKSTNKKLAKDTQTTPSLTVTRQSTGAGGRVRAAERSASFNRLPEPPPTAGPRPKHDPGLKQWRGTGPTAFHPLPWPTRCVTPHPVSRQCIGILQLFRCRLLSTCSDCTDEWSWQPPGRAGKVKVKVSAMKFSIWLSSSYSFFYLFFYGSLHLYVGCFLV